MKRIITIALVSLFIFVGFKQITYAHTENSSRVVSQASSPSSEAMKEDGTVKPVEYVLPYPGILPNHPLFALKTLRDWIMERLITDPVRKTEFYILQSDKRMAMAVAFVAQTKQELAAASARDAEAFMAKALAAALAYKTSGREVPGYIIDRFDRAIAKHIEIIKELDLNETLDGYQTLASQAATLAN